MDNRDHAVDTVDNSKSFIRHTVYEYGRKYKNVELIILSSISIFIPLFIGHPQILIGVIINALLFRSAMSMELRRALPIILLPSISAYMGSLLFGEATSFLLFFIPAIWVANLLYVLSAKFVMHKMAKDYGFCVLIASCLKAAFLFSAAMLAVNIFGFPEMFLTAMGIMQLLSALLGGYVAYGLTKAERYWASLQ